jgi:hypothetical protein
MGAFNINITGVGGHGCERKSKPGDSLYQRCGRFDCPDCFAFWFVTQLKLRGMLSYQECDATFTHWPGEHCEVVDDLRENKRRSGCF